ncbi:MAG: hypothetical protein QOD07_2476 [Frankiaceae bacterium]|nr:hypothetical protein [Frankiaceae bacterium]
MVDEGADKASAVGGAADGPVAGRCVVGGWPAGDWPAGTAARARGLLPAGRAAAGRGLDMRPLPLPLPENAGSRVATATSRGANAATVEPGRALGNRRTTGPGDAAVVAAAAGPELEPVARTAAAAGAGATVRITLVDDGLTVAVLRSSRALPAARSRAAPAGAAVGAAGAVRASPPSDATAMPPPAGRYDGELLATSPAAAAAAAG